MKTKFLLPTAEKRPAKVYWQDRHRIVTSFLSNEDADRLDKLCEKAGFNGKPMSVSKMVKHMIEHCLRELGQGN